MKKILFVMMAVVATFMLASCEKTTKTNEPTAEKSVLTSLEGTEWTLVQTDEILGLSDSTVMKFKQNIGYIEYYGASTLKHNGSYTYNNPIVTIKYTTTEGEWSAQVAKDGKTMVNSQGTFTRTK